MNRSSSKDSGAAGPAPQVRRLGRYEIEAELGRGAMGVVYRARDPIIDRVLAIKTVDPGLAGAALAGFRERFFREARAAGKLNHPCIVTIYDAGEAEGVAYMAMELLEGASLRDLLCGTPLPVERALDIAMQLAYALAYAHDAGVVHRDVKPENVIIAGRRRVKLTDFGIASLTRVSGGDQEVAGSPKYMSPEQVRGEDVDGRSDVFSLGVLLYEMLAGVQPFTGSEVQAIVHQVLEATPARPSAHNPLVPAEIDTAVLRMLAKDADERLGNARRVYRELRRWLKARGAEIDERDERIDRLDVPVRPASPLHAEPTLVLAPTEDPSMAARFARPRPALVGVLVGVVLASAVAIASLGGQRAEHASVIEVVAAKDSGSPATASVTETEPVPASPIVPARNGREKAPPAAAVPVVAVHAASPSPRASVQSRAVRKAPPETARTASTETVALPSEPVAAAPAEPAAAPSRTGTVRLAISPWGEVFIDGKFRGMTPPMDAVELPPGRHRLEIRNSLQPTYIADVRLDAGDTQHIRHRFE
jgi:serine/threonine-protein kinase